MPSEQQEQIVLSMATAGTATEVSGVQPTQITIVSEVTTQPPEVKEISSAAEVSVSDQPTIDADQSREIKEAYVAPWHINPEIQARASKNQLYEVLDASEEVVAKVFAAYQHAPIPHYSIRSVRVIYNPTLNGAFGYNLDLLEERHRQPVFNPAWRKEEGTSRVWREQTYQVLEKLAAPYVDLAHPNVKLVPMWHTTNREILDSLFKVGFANLSIVDAGFFGAGIYSAGEAAYSYGVYHRLYKKPVLLFNWVATYSAYPVIHRDMKELAGKGVKARYDAHFIPVRPKTNKPNEMNFYPCAPDQPYQYTELVVFEKAQCLPRYVVELQSDDIPLPLAPAGNSADTSKAATAEEKRQNNLQFGGAVNFFPSRQQSALGLLHKQSMLHTQFGQLQLNRYALLQTASEIAKKEIVDEPSCLACINQLQDTSEATQTLAAMREVHAGLTTLENQIAQTQQQLSALEMQKIALPEAQRVMMQTPVDQKIIAEQNKLRQHVMDFVTAMQNFLTTQKSHQLEPGAHMQYVATVVSIIAQGAAVYNQRLEDGFTFPPPVKNFIQSYVKQNLQLWELGNHRDFAGTLKKQLITGDLQALKNQHTLSLVSVPKKPEDDSHARDKSCVMS